MEAKTSPNTKRSPHPHPEIDLPSPITEENTIHSHHSETSAYPAETSSDCWTCEDSMGEEEDLTREEVDVSGIRAGANESQYLEVTGPLVEDDDADAMTPTNADPPSSLPFPSSRDQTLPVPAQHVPTTWGSNFWVVLTDPITSTTFYANPSTGLCSWEPPVGALVLPRSEEGEYWELTDEKRGGRRYYYHTGTGKTQWTRPVDTLVIPLHQIQMSALKEKRSSRGLLNKSDGEKERRTSDDKERKKGSRTSGQLLDDPIDPFTSSNSSDAETAAIKRSIKSGLVMTPEHARRRSSSKFSASFYGASNNLDPSPSTSGTFTNDFDASLNGLKVSQVLPPILVNKTSSSHLAPFTQSATKPSNKLGGLSLAIPKLKRGKRSLNSPLTPTESGSSLEGAATAVAPGVRAKENIQREGDRRTEGGRTRQSTNPMQHRGQVSDHRKADELEFLSDEELVPPSRRFTLRKTASDNHLRKHGVRIVSGPRSFAQPRAASLSQTVPNAAAATATPPNTKRLSTGLHPVLPSAVADNIRNFRTEAYSKSYFATQRSGIWRRKTPSKDVMKWQSQVLSGPLLAKTKTNAGDIIRAFKVVQHVMGERGPVDDITSVPASSSSYSLADLADTAPRHGEDKWDRAEKRLLLEEERWLVQLGLNQAELRDEIYAILIKQVSANPKFAASLRGFRTLCVLVTSFPPSSDFEPYFRSFLQAHQSDDSEDGAIRSISLYCKRKLAQIMQRGPRSRAPMLSEIENAHNAAFQHFIFGEDLATTIERQFMVGDRSSVPAVLPFLANAMAQLEGFRTEGIFRIPAEPDVLGEMRARLDRGEYHLNGMIDPHVPANLFKLWLREIEDPIIPDFMYEHVLEASPDVEASCDLVKAMPVNERRVLIFIIAFLQILVRPEWSTLTKMTTAPLALVFAPNLMRPRTAASDVVYTHLVLENQFISNLIDNLPLDIDPEFPVTRFLPEPPSNRVVSSVPSTISSNY